MRRIIYNMVICCAAAWFLAACSNEYDIPGGQTERDGNSIILDISSGALPVSRATVPAEGAEVAVSHIDVLIFNENKDKVWSDRVSAPANKTGKITLAAKRENFTPVNSKYWVYLIANSTHAEADFESLADLDGLRAMTQEDRNIHMTGLTGEDVDLPETFLMDGIAYPEGSTEPEPAAVAPVVLYNGSKAEDTQLAVTLRRAAAKVVVTINKGDDVTFDNSPQAHEAGYYLRNMPYTTSVIAGVGGEAKLDDTGKTSGAYFNWTAEKITVTAYMYAHAWEQSSLEKEVRLVVNIPMTYSKDADPQLRPSNYYQIPVCSGKVLNRNTCYMVTATVNAPGAENPSNPVTLTDVKYAVEEWVDEMIEVGGEDGRPAYLTLNEYDLEMHNMENDNTSLMFTSSSAVHVDITSVYYYDKLGQKKTLEKKYPDNENNYEWGVKTVTTGGGWWDPTETITWSNECEIRIIPDEGINGKLDVHSTLPENNTIRYIEVKITNDEDIERIVTIEQYPLEYITNIQGWYSYRSDFGGTTWENKGNRNVSASNYNTTTKKWSYYQSNGSTYFFSSKVATKKDDGSSDIKFYTWDASSSSPTPSYNNVFGINNARMYHIRITATSGDYTLGKPRITGGITDPGKDNAQMVSPSFMLASQLGAVYSDKLTGEVEGAASHCKEYVEVAEDGTVYDDWRLPTEAELLIIKKFQTTSDAMDKVLTGNYYYAANGAIRIDGGSNGTAIRCIRDAYDDKK